MSPEHIHLATNHLPFIGLGLAIIPLLIGILGRNRPSLVGGLLLTMVCGWSVILVVDTGEEAYERYTHTTASGVIIDQGAAKWLDAHAKDARFFSKAMYGAAGFATVALIFCLAGSSFTYPLSWIVFILNAASLAVGFLIADSGAKIRRPDFRAEIRIESSGEYFADSVHRQFDVFS